MFKSFKGMATDNAINTGERTDAFEPTSDLSRTMYEAFRLAANTAINVDELTTTSASSELSEPMLGAFKAAAGTAMGLNQMTAGRSETKFEISEAMTGALKLVANTAINFDQPNTDPVPKSELSETMLGAFRAAADTAINLDKMTPTAAERKSCVSESVLDALELVANTAINMDQPMRVIGQKPDASILDAFKVVTETVTNPEFQPNSDIKTSTDELKLDTAAVSALNLDLSGTTRNSTTPEVSGEMLYAFRLAANTAIDVDLLPAAKETGSGVDPSILEALRATASAAMIPDLLPSAKESSGAGMNDSVLTAFRMAADTALSGANLPMIREGSQLDSDDGASTLAAFRVVAKTALNPEYAPPADEPGRDIGDSIQGALRAVTKAATQLTSVDEEGELAQGVYRSTAKITFKIN